jgi:hypothetical protein
MEGVNEDFYNQVHNLNSPTSSIFFETIADIPITAPDITSAEITIAEINSADITTPDNITPDNTTPENITPDITAPDITPPIRNEPRPKRAASARALENIRAVLEWEHCSKGSQLFKCVETHINSEFDSLNKKRTFANISKSTVNADVDGTNMVHDEDCMSEPYDTDHDQFNHDSTDDDDDDYSMDSFVVSDSAKLAYDSTSDDDAGLTDECSDDNADEDLDEDLDSSTSTTSSQESDTISEDNSQQKTSYSSSDESTHSVQG